jgi:Zn-dependent peptidase ImmA (M78 family)
LSEYIVEPKSRKDLRFLANKLREYLGLKDMLRIPIDKLLDILEEVLEDFSYEIVPDNELPWNVHAETNIRTGHISIKESVYDRACDGEGRDRMTIAHEIGHFFTLCFCGFSLQRNFSQKRIPPFEDPEWQAKCFAGEFMVAKHLTENMSIEEIASACGVSFEAAKYQYEHRN